MGSDDETNDDLEHWQTVKDETMRGDHEPLDAIQRGRLVITSGVSQLRIGSSVAPENLYESQSDFRTKWSSQKGEVHIGYHNYTVIDMFRSWRPPRARLDLNPAIPWEIELQSSATDFQANLIEIDLRGITIRGAVNDVQLDLATPVGTVPVLLAGGVTKLRVTRTPGVALKLRVRGSVARLTLDRQQLRPAFWQHSWTTADYKQATSRYDIEIRGGATDVAIGTIEPDE